MCSTAMNNSCEQCFIFWAPNLANKNTNIGDEAVDHYFGGNLVTNKVKINLHVLGIDTENGVCKKIYCTNVVISYGKWCREKSAKVAKNG